jgi:hypothetical protein
MKILALLLVLGCAGALAAVSLARPSATALDATVGPGFSIKLTKDGSTVSNLPAGDYTITVHDLSEEHNFHLSGGGISKATGVDTTGTETWDVTLRDDTYFFFCDAHSATMIGKFTVGDAPAPVTLPAPAGALKVSATATVVRRVVTVKATASRTAALDFSLWKGTKRAAHATARAKTATVKLKAPAAGRYVVKVVATAGTKATATRTVTVR